MKKLFLIIIGLCLCTALYADMNTYIIGAVSAGGCTTKEFENTTMEHEAALIFRSSSGKQWPAGLFTVGASGVTVCKVSMGFFYRAGTPSPDSFHAEIYTNNPTPDPDTPLTQIGGDSDSATFTDIATDDTVTDIEFTWSSDYPSLSAATMYWVVIKPDWTMTLDIYTSLSIGDPGIDGIGRAFWTGDAWTSSIEPPYDGPHMTVYVQD